jgi:hypothetical protein
MKFPLQQEKNLVQNKNSKKFYLNQHHPHPLFVASGMQCCNSVFRKVQEQKKKSEDKYRTYPDARKKTQIGLVFENVNKG